MECFKTTANGILPLTIIIKRYILHIYESTGYATVILSYIIIFYGLNAGIYRH